MRLAFNHALAAGENLLRLYQLNACSGKVKLETYTAYCAIGLTSTMNTVPLVYAWVSANESEESWTDVLKFLRTIYPVFREQILPRPSLSSNRDKRFTADISSVLETSYRI